MYVISIYVRDTCIIKKLNTEVAANSITSRVGEIMTISCLPVDSGKICNRYF
jgi:hypothetical protein